MRGRSIGYAPSQIEVEIGNLHIFEGSLKVANGCPERVPLKPGGHTAVLPTDEVGAAALIASAASNAVIAAFESQSLGDADPAVAE